MPAKRNQAEFRLQVSIATLLDHSAVPNMYWTALPFGEKRTPETGARLKRMGVKAGAPDVLLIKGGVCYGLELKRDGGRMAPSQVETANAWSAAGGIYHCAKGWQEAVDFLTKYGLVRISQ